MASEEAQTDHVDDSMKITICRPLRRYWRSVRLCPTCGVRSRMVIGEEPWYGQFVGCLACGESWQDGEMRPRPWAPRWRQDAAARHRKMYQEAGTKAEALAWLRAEALA